MPPPRDESERTNRVASADGGPGGGKKGRGGPGGGGDPAAMAAGMMERLDKNSDGKLEESELESLPEQAHRPEGRGHEQ